MTASRRDIILREFGSVANAIATMIAEVGPLTEVANPIAASFYANIRGLRQVSIDYLVKHHRIPVLALARDGDGLGATLGEAFVEIDDHHRFEFADPPHGSEVVRAIIVVARDESGYPLDLVAWAPKRSQTATYLARCAVLGEHDIGKPRIDEPLAVHRDVLSWLKAERRGIVILDPARAWRTLDGETLAAVDVEHGIELRRALQPPPPRIVVPGIREAA